MAQCCRARQSPVVRLVLDLELALFRYALKGLARVFDTILIVFAVRWQQPYNLVAATCAGPTDWARSIKYGLADAEFVRLQ